MTGPQGRTKGVIKVKLMRANRVVRSYKVRADTFTIGAAKGCTIRAAGDPDVAPKHATIYIEEGELMLVPEQGALVYLNGEEVDFAVPSPDDVIKIGRLNLQVDLVESMDTIPPGEVSRPSKSDTPKARPRGRSHKATLVGTALPAMSSPPGAAASKPKAVATPSPGERVSAPPPGRRTSVAPPPQRQSQSIAPAAASVQEVAPEMEAPTPLDQPLTDEDDTQSISRPPVEREIKRSPAAQAAPVKGVVRSLGGQLGDLSDEETEYYLSDDEEDEETFEEAFDLAEMLLKGTKKPEAIKDEGPKEDYCAAHVIRVHNGSVVDTFGVEPGFPYSTTYGEVECHLEGGKGKSKESIVENIVLEAARHVRGTVTIRGQKRALRPSEGVGMVAMVLHDGDSANLRGHGGDYKIEVYRPPLAPKKVPLLSISPIMLAMVIIIAILLHAAAAYSLRYFDFATLEDFLEEAEEEVFAEVKIEEPPKKVQEVVPEEMPEEDAKSIAERAPKVTQRSIRKRIKESPKTAVNNLLNILSRGSGKEGKSNKLKDLISNIDAVAGPGAGAFSIAGAIASLPGKDVNIAKSGGGGLISTLSGDDVAGKGSGIASIGKVKKKGKVRGKVTKMSSGAKVGGSLSREDVLKVINSHFHAVQACYERALMSNPTLSGRVAFDWTVSKTGSVKGVRVRSSTLGSPQVATCISNLIKRWKFPRPKGGEAIITFPFLFRVGS